ncbi:MAG: CopD family protein [Gammaproteobacteria bacterium]|nr:CopD family protein [Gammaproteobacteria bacterium]
MAFAVVIHLLSVVVWVGGMFFAWMVLRPAAAVQLEGPDRLRLWNAVFRRFFVWVWLAIALILLSGYWIIFAVFGGMAGVGLYVHVMQGIGLLMMLIFAHLYFAPYARLRKKVAAGDFPSAANELATIRRIVGINLLLGLLTVIIAAAGRYLLV